MSAKIRNLTSCSPAKTHYRFSEIIYLHLQGRRVSQIRKKQEAEGKEHWSLFSGSPLLKNVGVRGVTTRKWYFKLPIVYLPFLA
jgi:hypothetical protein